MTFETLGLALIAGCLFWQLYRALRQKPTFPSDKIRLVSKDTGEVLEMRVVPQTKKQPAWDENTFLMAAKWVFQKTMTAFVNCDLKELKQSLSPEVYQSFERDILARRAKKQKMDFSLICFDSVRILERKPDNSEITVCFQTEQINLLKNADGQVVEGDPMSVAQMTDTWIFRRIGTDRWLIAATQSRITPCAQ